MNCFGKNFTTTILGWPFPTQWSLVMKFAQRCIKFKKLTWQLKTDAWKMIFFFYIKWSLFKGTFVSFGRCVKFRFLGTGLLFPHWFWSWGFLTWVPVFHENLTAPVAIDFGPHSTTSTENSMNSLIPHLFQRGFETSTYFRGEKMNHWEEHQNGFTLENQHGIPKWRFGRWCSFSIGDFYMIIFMGVITWLFVPQWNDCAPHKTWTGKRESKHPQ